MTTERDCSNGSFDAIDWDDTVCTTGTCVREIEVIVVVEKSPRTHMSVDVVIEYDDGTDDVRKDERTWEYDVYDDTSITKKEKTVVRAGEVIKSVNAKAFRGTCYD